MSQRMPPVQYIMTGVSAGTPASAAGTAAPVASVGVSRNASWARRTYTLAQWPELYRQEQHMLTSAGWSPA